jgi:Kef-type K+ transport system membrane component KefB
MVIDLLDQMGFVASMFEWGTNVIIESFWHPFSRGCFQEMILVLFVIWYDSTLQSLLGIDGISQPLRAYMWTGTP